MNNLIKKARKFRIQWLYKLYIAAVGEQKYFDMREDDKI